MIIAVASDAHGAHRKMDEMLAALPRIDAFCFLGDMDKDAEYLDYGLRETQPQASFYAVAGNNDPFSARAGSMVLPFEEVKVFITHGHLFRGIRMSPRALAQEAQRLGCQLALYGHTHVAKDTAMAGVRVVNPGALMQGKWAVVEISGTKIDVTLHPVEE